MVRLRSGTSAALAALVGVAAVLRFWGLGRQGFWYDEADTALLVHLGAGHMLGLIPKSESTPPLYYCVAWVWSRGFGDDEVGLRSLSALAGVLVVPAIFLAALRLSGSTLVGLSAAALAACSPLLVWYSQEARAYELLVLFCALSWVAFAFALEDGERRWVLAWAVLSAGALATHYYAVILLIPQACVLLWRWRRRPSVWIAATFVGAVGLALLPLLIAQNSRRNDAWIHTVALSLRLGQILPQMVLGTGTPDRTVLKFVAFVLTGAGLVALVITRPRRGLLVAAMTLAGFGLALLFVAVGYDTLITRNLIGLWPGAAIAVACGIGALKPSVGRVGAMAVRRSQIPAARRWLAAVVTLGLCVIGLIAIIAVDSTYALQRPDWRPLAALLMHQPVTGNRLILIQHYGYDLPLALYVPALGFARHQSYTDVSQLDVIALGPEPGPPFCWWGAGCNLSPTRLQRSYRIPGFHLSTAPDHVEQFTLMRMSAAHLETVTRAEVAAALVDTTMHRDVLLIQRSRAS